MKGEAFDLYYFTYLSLIEYVKIEFQTKILILCLLRASLFFEQEIQLQW